MSDPPLSPRPPDKHIDKRKLTSSRSVLIDPILSGNALSLLCVTVRYSRGREQSSSGRLRSWLRLSRSVVSVHKEAEHEKPGKPPNNNKCVAHLCQQETSHKLPLPQGQSGQVDESPKARERGEHVLRGIDALQLCEEPELLWEHQ